MKSEIFCLVQPFLDPLIVLNYAKTSSSIEFSYNQWLDWNSSEGRRLRTIRQAHRREARFRRHMAQQKRKLFG